MFVHHIARLITLLCFLQQNERYKRISEMQPSNTSWGNWPRELILVLRCDQTETSRDRVEADKSLRPVRKTAAHAKKFEKGKGVKRETAATCVREGMVSL